MKSFEGSDSVELLLRCSNVVVLGSLELELEHPIEWHSGSASTTSFSLDFLTSDSDKVAVGLIFSGS